LNQAEHLKQMLKKDLYWSFSYNSNYNHCHLRSS